MQPRVLGHRGAPRVAIENTLAALLAALEQGAQGVEFDVRASRDGTLVLAHDETLERTHGRAVLVGASSAFSLAREGRGAVEGLVSLERALRALFERGAYANIEVKTDGAGPHAEPGYLARATAACVARAGVHTANAASRVVVSSFDPRVLLALRAEAPHLPRGLLLDPAPLADSLARSHWREVAPAAVHPCGAVVAEAEVARWRSLGLAVNVWTVDDPLEAERLARAGVTAVISNEPGAIASHLARFFSG